MHKRQVPTQNERTYSRIGRIQTYNAVDTRVYIFTAFVLNILYSRYNK